MKSRDFGRSHSGRPAIARRVLNVTVDSGEPDAEWAQIAPIASCSRLAPIHPPVLLPSIGSVRAKPFNKESRTKMKSCAPFSKYIQTT